jgi:hypothetical protein
MAVEHDRGHAARGTHLVDLKVNLLLHCFAHIKSNPLAKAIIKKIEPTKNAYHSLQCGATQIVPSKISICVSVISNPPDQAVHRHYDQADEADHANDLLSGAALMDVDLYGRAILKTVGEGLSKCPGELAGCFICHDFTPCC